MRTILRGLSAAGSVTLVLSACTSSPTAPAADLSPSTSASPTERTPPPDPGPRPERGECHLLSFAQAVAVVGSTNPVSCKRKHTAETYFVGRLDLRTEGGFVRRVDSRAAQRQARSTCSARLPKHLGRTPRELRLTMAQSVWFTPSPERAEAGADWFRCDVVAVAGPQRLQVLPRSTKAWGDAPAVAMCATAAPGTKAFRRVGCGSKHAWKAVSTVDIPGKELPSKAAIADRMEGPCGDAARAQADDPLDFRWSQESPTQEQWDAGQRYGICWVPT